METFLGKGKLSVRTSAKVRECFNEVEQEDEDRQSIVQDILRKIVSVEGQGGVTSSCACPRCHRFPLENYIWWVSVGHGKKQCNWWCAAVNYVNRYIRDWLKIKHSATSPRW